MRMKKLKSTLFTISLLASLTSQAQIEEMDRTNDRVYSKSPEEIRIDDLETQRQGEIRYIEDKRITRIDSFKTAYPGQRQGYRVQIFFGNREEALKLKAEFGEKYPDITSYISYLAPNFRLRVGDFRTRLEGERLKQKMTIDYPGCYLVKDRIELPPLREQDLSKEN